MAMSLSQRLVPEQHMHTVTIDEILRLGRSLKKDQPPLEHYFSPSRRNKFVRDYQHFLNSCLLDARHGKLDLDLYLMLVISFQFVIPLLDIPAEKEMDQFLHILESKYGTEDPDINISFTVEPEEKSMDPAADMLSGEGSDPDKGTVPEEEALSSFRQELDELYTGMRDVKESVQKRLKQDGIGAIMHWQQKKGEAELAEAFGRCIVIPVLFSFTDKKLLEFYRRTTRGIRYEVAVPELE